MITRITSWGAVLDAEGSARTMVERVMARPWGLAVAALCGDTTALAFESGRDEIGEHSLFQIGSVTKTMTGVLLADTVERGEVTPEAKIGALLGFEGGAAEVTLAALATQRSGLPRLPPNLDVSSVDPADPYAGYRHQDLVDALTNVVPGEPKFEYSNFGFMTLGAAVSAATGRPFAALLDERIFGPAGMTSAGCPPRDSDRLPGYAGSASAPWWTTQLPGAGGVGASISDVAAYLRAHLEPSTDTFGAAIVRATTIHAAEGTPMGYGWVHQGSGWWHNGGTGGFRSFVAFHRESATAVALLANGQQAESIDAVGFRTLTEMVAQA